MTRFCLWCASEYTPKRNATKKRHHKYCKPECRKDAWVAARSEKRHQQRNATKSIDSKSTK